ncbi:MAG: STAS/SEC14 domain-containing protein [Candidatus Thorarchaeota archaeon]
MVESEFYNVKFDESQNFLNLKLNGFWADKDLYKELEGKIKDLLGKTKPDWKMLVDLTDFKTPPMELWKEIAQIQEILVKKGLRKIAEILPKSIITRMAVNSFSSPSGLERHQFPNIEEAMAWLKIS